VASHKQPLRAVLLLVLSEAVLEYEYEHEYEHEHE
jgi:hypothetical protein